jgi:hypothetical protein
MQRVYSAGDGLCLKKWHFCNTGSDLGCNDGQKSVKLPVSFNKNLTSNLIRTFE